MTWLTDRQSIVDRLEAADLRVTVRLEKVSPPCVWVAFDGVDYGSGFDESTWRLFLVGHNTDEDRALTELQVLHEAVQAAGFSPTEAAEYVGLNVPAQADLLPALRFTTTIV